MVISSALASVNYGWETSWGNQQSTTDKTFGDVSNWNPNLDNSMISVPGLGSQDPSAQVAGNFLGNFSFDFVGRDWWLLRGIIGDPTPAGTGPYTYTYAYDNTPDSFTMDYGIDQTTDSVREFIGCQMDRVDINVNAGEVVTASVTGRYQKETESSAGFASQVAPTEDPFTAAQASLSLWGGAITPVTSVTLNLIRNLTFHPGLGSRLASARTYGIRTLDVAITLPFEDISDILDNVYGSDGAINTTTVAEPAGATVLTITNGEAGTALRSLVFTIPTATLFPKTESQAVTPGEIISEDVTLTARDLTSIVWTNNTAAEA